MQVNEITREIAWLGSCTALGAAIGAQFDDRIGAFTALGGLTGYCTGALLSKTFFSTPGYDLSPELEREFEQLSREELEQLPQRINEMKNALNGGKFAEACEIADSIHVDRENLFKSVFYEISKVKLEAGDIQIINNLAKQYSDLTQEFSLLYVGMALDKNSFSNEAQLLFDLINIEERRAMMQEHLDFGIRYWDADDPWRTEQN